MNLETYFAEKQGVGVLSTADNEGFVNSAIYARPHVKGKNTIMLIMRDRKTRANLQENKRASYLFLEHDHGYNGVRMYLTKTDEVQDQELIDTLTRRPGHDKVDAEERFLVTFRVDKVIALAGDKEVELAE